MDDLFESNPGAFGPKVQYINQTRLNKKVVLVPNTPGFCLVQFSLSLKVIWAQYRKWKALWGACNIELCVTVTMVIWTLPCNLSRGFVSPCPIAYVALFFSLKSADSVPVPEWNIYCATAYRLITAHHIIQTGRRCFIRHNKGGIIRRNRPNVRLVLRFSDLRCSDLNAGMGATKQTKSSKTSPL